jgi:hypothetical protein
VAATGRILPAERAVTPAGPALREPPESSAGNLGNQACRRLVVPKVLLPPVMPASTTRPVAQAQAVKRGWAVPEATTSPTVGVAEDLVSMGAAVAAPETSTFSTSLTEAEAAGEAAPRTRREAR